MKEAVIIGTIAREKGTDGDPSAVGAKWRVAGGGGNGTGLERANGWCRQKKNKGLTFSSFRGLDWDLDRIFPTPPLPEEKKTSSSGWVSRT